jgi:hypothetical protein
VDIYHIWCNLKPGADDMAFIKGVREYLEHLKGEHKLQSYRITRCKLGFRPPQLREFHITVEFENMAQMQVAFEAVSSRVEPIESLHHTVNSQVQDVFFALYRDFPDGTRIQGQEKF